MNSSSQTKAAAMSNKSQSSEDSRDDALFRRNYPQLIINVNMCLQIAIGALTLFFQYYND